jgi:uncharacterized protein YlxW (UPF0749 family)
MDRLTELQAEAFRIIRFIEQAQVKLQQVNKEINELENAINSKTEEKNSEHQGSSTSD